MSHVHRTVNMFSKNHIYRYHYKMFPVVEGERPLGVTTLEDLLAFFAAKLDLGDLPGGGARRAFSSVTSL